MNTTRCTPGPVVLEVQQCWDAWVVDTVHAAPTAGRVLSAGPELQRRCTFLAADLGRVPVAASWLGWLPGADVRVCPQSDFFAPDAGVLFEVVDGGWVAHVPAHGGIAVRGGVTLPLPPGPHPIDADEQVAITLGAVQYLARYVPRGERTERAHPQVDPALLGASASFGVLGLLMVLFTLFTPRASTTVVTEVPDRFAALLIAPADATDAPKPPGDPADEGQRAEGDEGRAGSKTADRAVARGDTKRAQHDRRVAEAAGALGAIHDDPTLAAMFSSSGLSSAIEDSAGGLLGAKGQQLGSHGLGARGGALGGGGDAGTLAGLGTRGLGDGDRAYGDGGAFAKKPDGAIVRGSDALLIGSMDRSLVDEVVKRHLPQLRYCYQREVTKAPDLAGKVVTRFVIAKDGTVASAETKQSTLGHAGVDACVANVFRRMAFPEPTGGGIVIVSYPLMFST